MYKLVPKQHKQRLFEVRITGEVNDVDCVTAMSIFTEKEFKAVVHVLKDFKESFGGSHELGDWNESRYRELFSSEQLEEMGITLEELEDSVDELSMPYCYSSGEIAHTLVDIEVTCIDIDGVTYDVEF